jgi:hypothetical protein
MFRGKIGGREEIQRHVMMAQYFSCYVNVKHIVFSVWLLRWCMGCRRVAHDSVQAPGILPRFPSTQSTTISSPPHPPWTRESPFFS